MTSKTQDSPSIKQIYLVVLIVTSVHLLGIAIYEFGIPKWTHKRVSDITIELGGSFQRGDGGQGISQASQANKAAEAAANPKSDDGILEKQNAGSKASQSSASGSASAEGGAAAGVQAAPTLDADYKAAYLNNPKPPYPAMAFKMRVEGTVILKVLIQPDGKCSEVLIAKTSGNESLDRSAQNTVSQWQFTPAKSQGKEISQWVNIPITFSIKNR